MSDVDFTPPKKNLLDIFKTFFHKYSPTSIYYHPQISDFSKTSDPPIYDTPPIIREGRVRECLLFTLEFGSKRF